MAIYSAVPPPGEHQAPPQNAEGSGTAPHSQVTTIDVDAWTLSALQALSVSAVARGVGSPLAIPIDEHQAPPRAAASRAVTVAQQLPRRPPSRRDSQRRREALLKGTEGSRQRRRWENDRLMHVPNAQPPQPADWEVHPTHPTHHVPYQLAQFWDRGVRQRVEDRTSRLQAARKTQQRQAGSATGASPFEVPRDLRETAKRTPAVRGWVRGLEEPVRLFLLQHRRGISSKDEAAPEQASSGDEMDSDDEEIVFVGRCGAMKELSDKRAKWKMARREVARQTVDSGMIFDSFGDDEGAPFQRWLTHAISDYYGLESRSVTLSNPARRVVYVGLKQVRRHNSPVLPTHMPRPLWEAC